MWVFLPLFYYNHLLILLLDIYDYILLHVCHNILHCFLIGFIFYFFFVDIFCYFLLFLFLCDDMVFFYYVDHALKTIEMFPMDFVFILFR